ncbi:hypothetical protein [Sulfurimonas sp.]|uniref:hypothetical protein n=1 Tax=Sulfurimonas sp. TaxID=2022749 RepID=UPI002B4A89AE|nr:hypothetical protein [Sulfurimonas sp.]
MKKYIINIFIFLMIVSDVQSAPLLASDIDPSNANEQIALIVTSLVAFLAFIMGSKRVLKFLG